MKGKAFLLSIFLAAPALAAPKKDLTVIYDKRPEAGLPAEARAAVAEDPKDYGPLRNVMPEDVHAITVRHYDATFKDMQDLRKHLASLLRSEAGHTHAHCPWAEALPVPSVEATVQFVSGKRGKWLLWPGRSAYRDPDMKWWFTYYDP